MPCPDGILGAIRNRGPATLPLARRPLYAAGDAASSPDAPTSREVCLVRALLSVASREGIAPFARDLLSLGVEVFATDGTREFLASENVDVRSVSELTGAESMAGGQVKTLHPAIYAGILTRCDRPDQLDELEKQGIGLIDLVAVNVSQFAPQVGVRLVPIDEAIEMID